MVVGGAMIAVTIGVIVGLFMGQAIVYAFGSKTNAAVMSFWVDAGGHPPTCIQMYFVCLFNAVVLSS